MATPPEILPRVLLQNISALSNQSKRDPYLLRHPAFLFEVIFYLVPTHNRIF